jgi:hypothetical protein
MTMSAFIIHCRMSSSYMLKPSKPRRNRELRTARVGQWAVRPPRGLRMSSQAYTPDPPTM